MNISVLVVSYNVREHLRRCLVALGADAEIIVADNASRDGSAAMVRAEFPRVQVIDMPGNCGFSAAVNAAARLATRELLLVLNPDTVVPATLLARMPAALERPGAVAAGFRQVDAAGHFQLSLGPRPSFVLELARRFVQLRLDAGSRCMRGVMDRWLATPRRVPWVSGAALLVRRSAFMAIAGFDERFFLYFEDIDFCLRLRAAGGEVYYDPTLVLTHLHGESAATDPGLAARAYRESQLYFWQKHRGRWARQLVYVYLKAKGLAPPPRSLAPPP